MFKTPSPRPYLTYSLMATCIAVYAYELFLNYTAGPQALEALFKGFGFSLPNLLEGRWYVPLTSIFVHGGPEHVILNMFALFFFGRALEEHVRKRTYLLVFFASALAGDAAIVLSNILGIMPAATPTIGASAAIFGLMGAAMLVKPLEFVAFPYVIPVPLVLVAVIYIIYNISAFVSVLVAGAESQISYVSHLGGLALGAYLGFRAEGMKRRLLAIALIFAVLLAIPLMWSALMYLEAFNYAAAISSIFGNA